MLAFPNLLDAKMQSMMHDESLLNATSAKVGLSEHMGPTLGRNSRSRERSCKNENEKLLNEIYEMMISHADRHYMGNRLCLQSAYQIKCALITLLFQYEIRHKL